MQNPSMNVSIGSDLPVPLCLVAHPVSGIVDTILLSIRTARTSQPES